MADKVRCAIYTRKSTDEGLDQGFNSLDAQREACAAYIASQRHEGWRPIKTRFDDGGLSGGTLERPALRSLLAEIEAGRVDMVVVYKIDRLTRSLSDFAKLVDRLDAARCSFVSVTQAFNTSSSMGRLTLNVLLSFAQFEREVTAERIRDKIAASKKKGLWMGGNPPLGYDPHPDPTRRELVANAREAETVQSLFKLYLVRGNLRETAQAAKEMGLRSKLRPSRKGAARGGHFMSRGHIHCILRNPVYQGLIRHKTTTYPGKHEAIIDEALWEQVQSMLQSAAMTRRGISLKSGPFKETRAPLIGRLRDETGDRLTPSHTNKAGRRYYYYVSNRLIMGTRDPTAWRLPARDFERSLGRGIADYLQQHAKAQTLLANPDLRKTEHISQCLKPMCDALATGDAEVLRQLVASGQVQVSNLKIDLNLEFLAASLKQAPKSLADNIAHLMLPFECQRRGVGMKIVTGTPCLSPNPVLLKALRNSHRWADRLRSGMSLAALAKETGHSVRRLSRIASLATLSPAIQTAILDGAQPADLTLDKLLKTDWPLKWPAQNTLLGLPTERGA